MLHALISAALFRPLAVHVLILRNKAAKAAIKALDVQAAASAATAAAIQAAQAMEKSDIENGENENYIKKNNGGVEKDVGAKDEDYLVSSLSSSCPQPSFMGDER